MVQRSNLRTGREQLGSEAVLWGCRLLNRESAGAKGATLFFPEPGEILEVDAHIADDLTQ